MNMLDKSTIAAGLAAWSAVDGLYEFPGGGVSSGIAEEAEVLEITWDTTSESLFVAGTSLALFCNLTLPTFCQSFPFLKPHLL